jgi:hypothetical protein
MKTQDRTLKKENHKRDGRKEQRISGTLRGEEEFKPETKLLIRDGEDNEAKARSLVDHYMGNKGTLTGQFNMS